MLQVSEIDAQMVWWFCAFAHFRGNTGCKKCALLAAMLLYTWYKPGVGKRVQGRVICRKPNTAKQRAAKPVCSVNKNTVKNANFTLNDVQ